MRVVATAGHVDHGKSTLVLALTGTDPDRFPEEKARGLTIDLGFAFTTLPSGTEVGFVDVPGHVRFIKNMLAGVGAVEVALMVVDASESWRPQSEEHLRILELLGVRHGLVALTKADTVDADALELAALEVAEHLSGSPLEDAPVIVCDSVSGRGMDEVRATLDAVLAEAPEARDLDRPRLWIDRVFTAKGAGTVVTGTLTGGSLAVDEDVEAGGRRARIRGIETAGHKVERVGPGTRVALNLAGVEHRDLTRGDAVVLPAQWVMPRVVDVRLRPLPEEEIRRRGRLHAYVGSGERRVWLRMLDEGSELARLRFDDPLPLAPGDRLVLRDAGRKRTVAGAEVLDVEPSARAKDARAVLARPLGERLLATHAWLAVADIPRLAGCSERQATGMVDELVGAGAGERAGAWIVSTASLAHVRSEATTRAVAHHAAHPMEPGVELATVATALRLGVDQLRAALAGESALVVERGVIRHTSHAGSAADTPDAQRVLAVFDATPFAPPAPKDIDADAALVRALVREGTLVDVDNVVFSASALREARARVVDALRERSHLSVADIRDVLGSTRKYVLPIVGWLDREGVTRRRGDDRHPGPASGLGELL
jgi:selenocysteine-specific elongation factor